MIAGVSCWPRSRHGVNKIWSSELSVTLSFAPFCLSFLCVLSLVTIFHCQVFVALGFYNTLSLSSLLLALYVSLCLSRSLLCLQDRFNQQDAGWHSLSHPFHFVPLQINVLHVLICGSLSLLYKHEHKTSFITLATLCSMNVVKYSFKYVLRGNKSAGTNPYVSVCAKKQCKCNISLADHILSTKEMWLKGCLWLNVSVEKDYKS